MFSSVLKVDEHSFIEFVKCLCCYAADATGPAFAAAVVDAVVDAVVGHLYNVFTSFHSNSRAVLLLLVLSMSCFLLGYLSFTFVADLLLLDGVGLSCVSSLTMSIIDAG